MSIGGVQSGLHGVLEGLTIRDHVPCLARGSSGLGTAATGSGVVGAVIRDEGATIGDEGGGTSSSMMSGSSGSSQLT